MKKATFLVLTMLLLSTSLVFSQETDLQKAQKYIKDRGEVCFTFKANTQEQFKEIASFLSIGHRHVHKEALEIEAYANKHTFEKFLAYGLDFHVKKEDNELTFDPHKSASAGTNARAAWDTTWDAYPKYSEYVAKMNYYATTYPNICSLQNIGTTQSGRQLLVLKISDNIAVNEGEPQVFYTSTMHGDELAGFPLMIRLIDYLLTNYSTDPEVQNIINNTELYINPNANPDGSYRLGDTDAITSPRRANDSGIDLNRNYPDNAQGLHYHHSTYEAETIAFMNFANSKNFVLSANFHGGTELVNYPYDNIDATSQFTHADTDYFEYISVEYATNAQNDSGATTYMEVDEDSHYIVSPGVTHGAEWYQVYGGRQDYMNYYRNDKEVTIELSFSKFLSGSQLPAHWTYNKQALLDYIKQANFGLHGTITDESGNPVKARVEIIGHDKLNTFRNSDPETGAYQKLLKGGTYSVTYSAPGYTSQTISVSITDNVKTTQDVTLVATTATPTAADDQLCDSGSVTLSATGTGTLNWYSSVDGDTPVHTGASYTTPTINTTTSYYVEDVVSKPDVGSSNASSNGGFHTNSQYLIFDNTEAVMLKQVTVNASSAGEIEVALQDSSGDVLDARVIFVSGGVETIDLDFMIPVANNLRLVGVDFSSASGGLYRNNSGVSYPYSNGSITIKSSSANTNPSNYYYFFYDWKLGNIKSARKEVTVTVDPSPDADFTFVVNPANNGEVTFTNTSSDATSYSWDFGDSSGTSTNTNPVYTFASTGTYDVELTSTNAECGNDSKTIQVSVTVDTLGENTNELEQISVSPNPFTKQIDVNLGNITNDVFLKLFDIRGREISSHNYSNQNIIRLESVGALSAGTYFLKITDNISGNTITRKLIKQ